MRRGGWRRSRGLALPKLCALYFLFVFTPLAVCGEGMGKGRSRREVGALSVAREGRVPLLVLLAVFARPYVDVAAKIALDRYVPDHVGD